MQQQDNSGSYDFYQSPPINPSYAMRGNPTDIQSNPQVHNFLNQSRGNYYNANPGFVNPIKHENEIDRIFSF